MDFITIYCWRRCNKNGYNRSLALVAFLNDFSSSAELNFPFPSGVVEEVSTSMAERVTCKIGGRRERGVTGQENYVFDNLTYLSFSTAFTVAAARDIRNSLDGSPPAPHRI